MIFSKFLKKRKNQGKFAGLEYLLLRIWKSCMYSLTIVKAQPHTRALSKCQ